MMTDRELSRCRLIIQIFNITPIIAGRILNDDAKSATQQHPSDEKREQDKGYVRTVEYTQFLLICFFSFPRIPPPSSSGTQNQTFPHFGFHRIQNHFDSIAIPRPFFFFFLFFFFLSVN